MRGYGRLQGQAARILELYAQRESLERIAAEVGGSRQGVSRVLISLGVDPQARRMERARERRELFEAQYRLRQTQPRRYYAGKATVDARCAAAFRLEVIADGLGVTASTLSQWVAQSGVYSVPRKPRVDAILPPRFSEEGLRVAREVEEACAPWAARYLWSACLRSNGQKRAEYEAWLEARR